MGSSEVWGISRRGMLRGAGALMGSALFARAGISQMFTENLLGDAHVHLFNITDLPSAGFARETRLHSLVGTSLADTVVHLIDHLKSHAPTAAAELAHPNPADEFVTKHRLLLLIVEQVRNEAAKGPPLRAGEALSLVGQRLSLQQGYAILYGILAGAERLTSLFSGGLGTALETSGPTRLLLEPMPWTYPAETPSRRGREQGFDRQTVRALLRGTPPCPESPGGSVASAPLAERIRAPWGFVHQMMQTRRYNLETYLRRMGDPYASPRLLINLLVDMDKWVDDCPSPGSSAGEQIALWSNIRNDYLARGIDIRTFAGFDPLRHAEERLTSGSAAHFESLKGLVDPRPARSGGKASIQGFKLYPPMGFRPWGNEPLWEEAALQHRRTNGQLTRADRIVTQRWYGDDRLRGCDIGEEIDNSLDAFYAHCSRHGIPIMAHAYHSNEAAQCAGARASPAGWMQVVRAYPGLRLCLAHFGHAADFVRARERWDHPERIPPNVWSLLGTNYLIALNSVGPARVYADLSYVSELLLEPSLRHRGALAHAFFADLKQYCLRYDPDCHYLMYGTDWHMLALEPRHERYLDIMRQAMHSAGWPQLWQRNFLHDNLMRFLEDGST